MIKPRLMAQQRSFDAAQADDSGKLAVEHGRKLTFGGQFPGSGIRLVLLHQPIEPVPRNEFQQGMKYY
jgi:hypothetical protein